MKFMVSSQIGCNVLFWAIVLNINKNDFKEVRQKGNVQLRIDYVCTIDQLIFKVFLTLMF